MPRTRSAGLNFGPFPYAVQREPAMRYDCFVLNFSAALKDAYRYFCRGENVKKDAQLIGIYDFARLVYP